MESSIIKEDENHKIYRHITLELIKLISFSSTEKTNILITIKLLSLLDMLINKNKEIVPITILNIKILKNEITKIVRLFKTEEIEKSSEKINYNLDYIHYTNKKYKKIIIIDLGFFYKMFKGHDFIYELIDWIELPIYDLIKLFCFFDKKYNLSLFKCYINTSNDLLNDLFDENNLDSKSNLINFNKKTYDELFSFLKQKNIISIKNNDNFIINSSNIRNEFLSGLIIKDNFKDIKINNNLNPIIVDTKIIDSDTLKIKNNSDISKIQNDSNSIIETKKDSIIETKKNDSKIPPPPPPPPPRIQEKEFKSLNDEILFKKNKLKQITNKKEVKSKSSTLEKDNNIMDSLRKNLDKRYEVFKYSDNEENDGWI